MTAHMRVIRTEYNNECTRGLAFLDDKQFAYTLELPWRDNRPDVSCIPEGTYRAEPWKSKLFGSVWVLLGVKGRSSILIHRGNTAADTHGCILLGSKRGRMGAHRAVLSSVPAIGRLRALVGTEPMMITVKNAEL